MRGAGRRDASVVPCRRLPDGPLLACERRGRAPQRDERRQPAHVEEVVVGGPDRGDVKVSNSTPGFWGLTGRRLDLLLGRERSRDRWIVLLAGSAHAGYILEWRDVLRKTKRGEWKVARDGD